MTLEIHDSCESVGEAVIRQVERQLGYSLPASYRRFLLTHNGGSPEPDVFPLKGDPSGDYARVHYFLCVDGGDLDDLMDWFSKSRGRVPSNLIPVACDPLGNLICLSVSGEDVGTVYFWDHEEEADEGESPGYDNVYYIADSFRQFLDSLISLD